MNNLLEAMGQALSWLLSCLEVRDLGHFNGLTDTADVAHNDLD